MKLLCVNVNNVFPGLLEVGREYEINEWGSGCYEVSNRPVSLSNFEGIKDRFKRLAINANKIILAAPSKGVTVNLLLTDKYIIVYARTKGNHWNIFGNHSKYYHDINTGEFIPDHNVQKHETPKLKERLLMPDYNYILINRSHKTR